MDFCAYRSNESGNRCICSNKMIKVRNGNIPISLCEGCPWQARLIDENMVRPITTGDSVITSNPNFPEQPGIIEIGTNFIKSTAKHIMNGGKSVSKEVYEERLNICNGCEHREGNKCRRCTCNLSMKCARPLEECPIKKWLAQKGE